MKKFECPEGHEVRGFVFRIYPTPEQLEIISSFQDRQRVVWNTIVSWSENARKGYYASLIRSGIIEKPPVRPANDAGEEPWNEYHEEYETWSKTVPKPPKEKYRTIKEECEHFGVDFDYQLGNRILSWQDLEPLPAAILQALFKNVFSKGLKQFRKRSSDMSIRVRSLHRFQTGDFGTRRKASF